MKYLNLKPYLKVYPILLFCGIVAICSCKKNNSSPATSNTSKPATFTAQVNGSSTLTFTPTKKISGGNVSLIGTSTYYTITLTFPSTTGQGSVVFSSTVNASIVNGSNTYVANGTPGAGTGNLNIDSIINGTYYGGFSFIGENSSSNAMTVNAGIFKNL